MEQVSKQQPVNKTAFRVLVALSVTHCLNDSLQSVISAVYPLFKDDLALSFAQIGLITLVYQLSASVFQPITGLVFDKRPVAWSLPIGMSFTLVGLLNLAFSSTLHWVLISVFLIGIGSSVLHPEASRITSLASGGRRGLAQSLFQVGGNLGGSLGPLLVALLVAPYGRTHIALFSILAFVAILVMIPICRWYKAYLSRVKWQKKSGETHVEMPLSLDKNKAEFKDRKTAYSVTAGATYNFGVVTAMGIYQYAWESEMYSQHAFGLSASAPLAGGTAKLGARYLLGKLDGDAKNVAKALDADTKYRAWNIDAGYTYPLSKRTYFYGFAGYSDGAKLYKDVENGKFNGWSVGTGLVHKF